MLSKLARKVFRIVSPLLIFQQIAIPLTAYAETTYLNDDELRKLEKDWRTTAKRKENQSIPFKQYNPQYLTAPPGWNYNPNRGDKSIDQQKAQEWANKYLPASKDETLQGARSAHEVAKDAFINYSNARNAAQEDFLTGDKSKIENERGRDPNKFSFHELLPGYGPGQNEYFYEYPAQMYDNPAIGQTFTKHVQKYLNLQGCKIPNFEHVIVSDQSQAFSNRAHRVLSIKFYDYKKIRDVVPSENDTEPCYQNYSDIRCKAKTRTEYEYTQSVYKGGSVKLEFSLIGKSGDSWNELVDDNKIIAYDYNPFSVSNEYNYFPYNVRLYYKINGSIVDATDAIVSYGSSSDNWKPSIAWTPPLGVEEIVITADLYKVRMDVVDPEVLGGQCPPFPPMECTKTAKNGAVINWCPDQPSRNIVTLFTKYNEYVMESRRTTAPALSGKEAQYTSDLGFKALLHGKMNVAENTVRSEATCKRVLASTVSKNLGRNNWDQGDYYSCSKRLLSAFEPNGCQGIRRQFGATNIGNHVFLTVRAWKITKQLIPNSNPPRYTYVKEPANVTGSIDLSQYPVFGGYGNSIYPPDNQEGYFLEFSHTPTPLDPTQNGVAKILMNGTQIATGSYGTPKNNWTPVGTVSAPGTSVVEFAANIYQVTVNDFSGCEKYLDLIRDNQCQIPTLNCTDLKSEHTIGGLTFGPGLPTHGWVDVLSPWIPTYASNPDYDVDDGGSAPSNVEVERGNDILPRMCWMVSGGPIQCGTPMGNSEIITEPVEGGTLKWESDCNTKNSIDGQPITSCRKVKEKCSDDNEIGLFSGMCYDIETTYDCGKYDAPESEDVKTKEYVDQCEAPIRCVGTECHRPNLSGHHADQFAMVAGAMETINHIKYDMVCAETGEPPKSVDDQCTPLVFQGKAMSCSYATGWGKVFTTIALVDGDCCKEARKQAAPMPSWERYMQIYYLTKKISETTMFQNAMSSLGLDDIYNSVAKTFGEVSSSITKPFTSAFDQAADFLNQNIAQPASTALDRFFGGFGSGSGADPASTGVDALAKSDVAKNYFSNITSTIDNFKSQLLKYAYDFVASIDVNLANAIFEVSGTGQVVGLNPTINAIFTWWAIFRLVVTIVFACKQSDYEWGVNNKWRLCTEVGRCCSKKKRFIGCVQRKILYCCYKSIVARVIATEIIKKGLVPGRNGYEQRKCSINCNGFTIEQLGQVDWSQVDMTEAITAMIDAGILNPNNPNARYGAYGNELSTENVVGLQDVPNADHTVAAEKTANAAISKATEIHTFTDTISNVKQCYDPNAPEKMPYAYTNCDEEEQSQQN